MSDDQPTRTWLEERDLAQQAFFAEQAQLNRKHQSRMAWLLIFAVPISMVCTVAGGFGALLAVVLMFRGGFDSSPTVVTSSDSSIGPTLAATSGPTTYYVPSTTYAPTTTYTSSPAVWVPDNTPTSSPPRPILESSSVPVTRRPLPSPPLTPQPVPDPISGSGVAPASHLEPTSPNVPR